MCKYCKRGHLAVNGAISASVVFGGPYAMGHLDRGESLIVSSLGHAAATQCISNGRTTIVSGRSISNRRRRGKDLKSSRVKILADESPLAVDLTKSENFEELVAETDKLHKLPPKRRWMVTQSDRHSDSSSGSSIVNST